MEMEYLQAFLREEAAPAHLDMAETMASHYERFRNQVLVRRTWNAPDKASQCFLISVLPQPL
jgi:hypothetical protein